MKKICAILFALMIVVSALSVSALAAGDPQLTVTTDKSVVKEVGEVINVTVTLDNAAGVTSIGFDLSYPGFEFVTGSNVSPIAGSFMMCQYVPTTQKFLATGAMVPLADSSVVAMTFQLKATSVGDSTIGISNCQIAVGSTKYTPSGVPAQISHDHVWGEAVVVNPTCKDDGSETRPCTVPGCDKTDVKVLPATGEHVYTSVVTEPTCTEEGYTTFTCGCGESYVGDKVAAKGHNHVKDEEKSVAADCKNDGKDVLVCACGDKKEVVVPATGDHNYATEVERVDATCEADGYVKYACGCGTVSEDATVLPKLGHKFETYTETKAPTCTEKGEETATCANGCGKTDVKEIDKVPHNYEEVNKIDPTCETDGAIESKCSVCGADTAEILPALGHTWGEWKVTVEATKTEKGEKVRVCEVCQETETKEIPATGSVAPKTGDEANIALYAVIFMMAAAGVVVLSLKKKEN